MQQNRLTLARARHDTRDWVQERRARTRQLIELGGLVQKAGLVELLDDDRATLLGALLDIASRLQPQGDERQEERPAGLKARWRRQGLRAFDADAAPAGIQQGSRPEDIREDGGLGTRQGRQGQPSQTGDPQGRSKAVEGGQSRPGSVFTQSGKV